MIRPVGVLSVRLDRGHQLIWEFPMKSTTRTTHRALAAIRSRSGETNPTEGSRAKLTMAEQSHRGGLVAGFNQFERIV